MVFNGLWIKLHAETRTHCMLDLDSLEGSKLNFPVISFSLYRMVPKAEEIFEIKSENKDNRSRKHCNYCNHLGHIKSEFRIFSNENSFGDMICPLC